MKRFKPDAVIGTGGYVCGPVVYAAAKKKIPTVIHEQNSVPGLTNKFLSRYVDKVAICFESVRELFPENKVVLDRKSTCFRGDEYGERKYPSNLSD